MKKLLLNAARALLEILLLVGLVAIVWHTGSRRLEGWNGPAGSLTNDLFVPAIMMNAGRGFVNMEPSDLPEMRAFLDFRAQEFDLALVRNDTALIPLHPFQEFHRYLIYTVALTWRVYGVNWDAIKILILVYFCLAAAAVYGICRLGMNPLFSFAAAAAFIHAQPVLWALPILRDFVKAPFILGFIFLLALTIRRRFTVAGYFAIAALGGVVLGVGMGFRRDMMVFLPVAVFFLVVCRVTPGRYPVLRRILAPALLIALYFASGWPVHSALRRDGYVAAHDTIMGFASYSDHELGVLHPASYEKHYLLNDLFCTLKAHDAARRGVTFPPDVYTVRCNEPEFDLEMKQAYVFEIVKTFPGDMLTRAYAAVVRMSTAIIASPNPVSRAVENRGLWFMLAGLILLAARRPLQAWLVLIVLCYFCGYTSIQFAGRHAFHMSFVPYFFAGLTFQQAGELVACLLPERLRARLGMAPRPGVRAFPAGAAKALGWTLATALMLYAPLALARAWQYRTVEALRASYADAELTPVPHRVLEWNGRQVFIPAEGRSCHLCQTMGLIVDIETRHIAAAFKQVDEPLDLLLVYEWEGLSWDFSAPATFNLRDMHVPGDMKYFFPVHETTTCTDWNHFVGLSLPVEQAHFFEGFYQVNHLDSLGLLVNMIVPEREEQFIHAQHLDLPWSGGQWSNYTVYEDFNPFLVEMDIRGAIARGDYESAAMKAREALEARPQSIQFTFLLAEVLDLQGEAEQARAACLGLLEFYPDTFVLFARLDRFFDERGGVERRVQEWESLLELDPTLTCAQHYLEAASWQRDAERFGIDAAGGAAGG